MRQSAFFSRLIIVSSSSSSSSSFFLCAQLAHRHQRAISIWMDGWCSWYNGRLMPPGGPDGLQHPSAHICLSQVASMSSSLTEIWLRSFVLPGGF
ncbi:hypothetical protein IWX47DRAFT_883159 [Phyllosticta citricarpa]